MTKKIIFIGLLSYFCCATSVRGEDRPIYLTVFKDKPRGMVFNEVFSLLTGVATSPGATLFYSIYVMQHHVQIENTGNNSTCKLTPNPAKVDFQKVISQFFQMQGSETIHEDLMQLYHIAIASDEYIQLDTRHQSDLLFTLNQVILLVYKLEKLA